MKRFVLTSDSFKGQVVLGYNEDGLLSLVENDAIMTEKQFSWFWDFLPIHESQLSEYKRKVKGYLEELPEDISFDAFWNRYGKKINKIRCEPIFKKLKDAEKLLAIRNIKPYEEYLERTGYRGKCDPENYFKKGYWNVDWKAERV
ncbi:MULTISPECIES: hypothetical protein [Sphingobacterium]|uniref:hypothetical protein n=1 Tax=Sphingobacterium TaxID=28453 RepID=UPI0010C2BBAE|nr:MULTISPECIES: hypothetical protein [Sphingobacterium]MCC2598033.1 hypothetical protein [Sphingobacterium sp. FBM7-1]VTP94921.1 Uncharacterised protein [Sphingobacterium daejeonense]